MSHHLCPVCCEPNGIAGAPVLGEPCPACRQHLRNREIALVETNDAGRTGRIFWMKRAVAERVFEIPVSSGAIMFVGETIGKFLPTGESDEQT